MPRPEVTAAGRAGHEPDGEPCGAECTHETSPLFTDSLIQQRGTEHPLGSSAKAKDLTQVSTNFFCKGPTRKYFQLGGSEVSVAATQLCLVEGNSHRQHCVPAKDIYKKAGGPARFGQLSGLTNS